MYDTILTLVLFTILFFLYVHIFDHYKTSEDLEIYEMDYTNNLALQEICSVKQPTIFELRSILPRPFKQITIENILAKHEKAPLVQVKDVNDYWLEPTLDTVDSVPLNFATFHSLVTTDSKSHYFTDSNGNFVENSYLNEEMPNIDDFIKPDFATFRSYDLLMGAKGCPMPMQYHNHYRRFLISLSGKAHVKMTPWKSRKYLHPTNDYENYEFVSKINVWKAQRKYEMDYEQTRFLEFDLLEGYVLYIPPYWWYSISFTDSNSLFLSATYDTVMSTAANSVELAKYFFQQHNIKEKLSRTFVPEPLPKVEEVPIVKPVLEETAVSSPPPKEIQYSSGEPHTANASVLVEQLKSREQVPIRDQSEQMMHHVLG
jgi:hypothetical protein